MKLLRRFPYWYLILIPILLTYLGAASNQAVFVANHGKFPVSMNATWMDKQCSLDGIDPDDVAAIPAISCRKGGEMIDKTHSVMGPNSHLKVLADIFNLGNMYSIGDGFIALGEWLMSFCPYMWLALVIRKVYVWCEQCPSKV